MNRLGFFILRWFKIVFLGYYDPRLRDSRGMRYVVMPSGEIRRVDRKKEFRMNRKEKRKIKELRRFFS